MKVRINPPGASKPCIFIGSAKKDLKLFPEDVQDVVGQALWLTQMGLTPPNAKMLRGFGGGTVLEIVDDYQTDTYRAGHTVRFQGVVYVLHCFQKKSKRGSAVPKADKELIESRLQGAQQLHALRRDETTS